MKERKVVTNEIFVSPHAVDQAVLRRLPFTTATQIEWEVRAGIVAGRQANHKPTWARLVQVPGRPRDKGHLLTGQFAVWDEGERCVWVVTRQAIGHTHRYIVATTLGRTAAREEAA